jgi:hypothetical protein
MEPVAGLKTAAVQHTAVANELQQAAVGTVQPPKQRHIHVLTALSSRGCLFVNQRGGLVHKGVPRSMQQWLSVSMLHGSLPQRLRTSSSCSKSSKVAGACSGSSRSRSSLAVGELQRLCLQHAKGGAGAACGQGWRSSLVLFTQEQHDEHLQADVCMPGSHSQSSRL